MNIREFGNVPSTSGVATATIALILCIHFTSAVAQNLNDAVLAWRGGTHASRDVPVVKDGVRCSYSQTARPGYSAGHLIVGFWSPGCDPSQADFEFPVSRVQISKQGSVCVFECTGGAACLKQALGNQRAVKANIYEALPGTCNALAAAISRVAAQAEAVTKAEEDKVARQQEIEHQKAEQAKKSNGRETGTKTHGGSRLRRIPDRVRGALVFFNILDWRFG